LVKLVNKGGQYPLGRFFINNADKGKAPADALKLGGGGAVTGAQWVYGGLSGQSATNDCSCHFTRFGLDRWARPWIGSNQLCSLTVLDTNGNRIARFGRYGNVNDTDDDVKAGRDGLRFSWIRMVAASDTAVYAADPDNRRILKAALSYAAEETVPAP
jgi:hypothetical protein